MDLRPRVAAFLRALALAVLTLGIQGCVEELGITDGSVNAVITVRLVPTFDPALANTPASTRIAEVELSVLNSGSGTVLSQTRVPRDPDSEDTTLELRVEIEEGSTIGVEGTLRLFGTDGTIEWSGTFGPITVNSVDEVQEILLAMGRGDLGNLAVTALSLTGLEEGILEGEVGTLTAHPTGHPGTAVLFWSVSNPGVLTLSPTGEVQALHPGEVVVSVAAGRAAVSRTIRVHQKAVSVAIDPTEHTFPAPGSERTFTATALDPRGAPVEGRTVQWSSSNPAIVDHLGGGLFRAMDAGEALITAAIDGLTAQAPVFVAGGVETLGVSPTVLSFDALQVQAALTASALDVFGEPVADAEFTFESSDESVATVDADGVVTAISNGTAQITVRSGARTAFAQVTVSQLAAMILVEPATLHFGEIGQKATITATAFDATGIEAPNAVFAWTSSNDEVATVNATGEVLAVAPGTARIIVTSGGAIADVIATVEEPAPEHLLLIESFRVAPILRPDIVVPGSLHRFDMEISNAAVNASQPLSLRILAVDAETEEPVASLRSFDLDPIAGGDRVVVEEVFTLPTWIESESMRFRAELSEALVTVQAGDVASASVIAIDPDALASFVTVPFTLFAPDPEAFLTCAPGYTRIRFNQPFIIEEFPVDRLERIDMFVEAGEPGPWFFSLQLDFPHRKVSSVETYLFEVEIPTDGVGGSRISFVLPDGGISGLEGTTVRFFPFATNEAPGVREGEGAIYTDLPAIYYLAAGGWDCPALFEEPNQDQILLPGVYEEDEAESPALELFEGEGPPPEMVDFGVKFLGTGVGSVGLGVGDLVCAIRTGCEYSFVKGTTVHLNFVPAEGSVLCGVYGVDPNEVIGTAGYYAFELEADFAIQGCFAAGTELAFDLDFEQFGEALQIGVGFHEMDFRSGDFLNASRWVPTVVPTAIDLDFENQALILAPGARFDINISQGDFLGIETPDWNLASFIGVPNGAYPNEIRIQVFPFGGSAWQESWDILDGRIDFNASQIAGVRIFNDGEEPWHFRPRFLVADPAPVLPESGELTLILFGTGAGTVHFGESSCSVVDEACTIDFIPGVEHLISFVPEDGSEFCGLMNQNPIDLLTKESTHELILFESTTLYVCMNSLSDAVLPLDVGQIGAGPTGPGEDIWEFAGTHRDLGNLSAFLPIVIENEPMNIVLEDGVVELAPNGVWTLELADLDFVGRATPDEFIIELRGKGNENPADLAVTAYYYGEIIFQDEIAIRDGDLPIPVTGLTSLVVENVGGTTFRYGPVVRSPRLGEEPSEVTLRIEPMGSAPVHVVLTGDEGFCGAGNSCEFTFPAGTEIALEAILPTDGSTFCGFFSASPNHRLTGSNVLEFEIFEDITIRACADVSNLATFTYGPEVGVPPAGYAVGSHLVTLPVRTPFETNATRNVTLTVETSPLEANQLGGYLLLAPDASIEIDLGGFPFTGIQTPDHFIFRLEGLGNEGPLPLEVDILWEDDLLQGSHPFMQNGRQDINVSGDYLVRITNAGEAAFGFLPSIVVPNPLLPVPDPLHLIIDFIGNGKGTYKLMPFGNNCVSTSPRCEFIFSSTPAGLALVEFEMLDGARPCGVFSKNPYDFFSNESEVDLSGVSGDVALTICVLGEDEALFTPILTELEMLSFEPGFHEIPIFGNFPGMDPVGAIVPVFVQGEPLGISTDLNAVALAPGGSVLVNASTIQYLELLTPEDADLWIDGTGNSEPVEIQIQGLDLNGLQLFLKSVDIRNGYYPVDLEGLAQIRVTNQGEETFYFKPVLDIVAPPPVEPDIVQISGSFIGMGSGWVEATPGGDSCYPPGPCFFEFPAGTDVTLELFAQDGSSVCGFYGTNPNDRLSEIEIFEFPASQDRNLIFCADLDDRGSFFLQPHQLPGGGWGIGEHTWTFPLIGSDISNASRSMAVEVLGAPVGTNQGSGFMILQPGGSVLIDFSQHDFVGVVQPTFFDLRLDGRSNINSTEVKFEILDGAMTPLIDFTEELINGRVEVNMSSAFPLVQVTNMGDYPFGFLPSVQIPHPQPGAPLVPMIGASFGNPAFTTTFFAAALDPANGGLTYTWALVPQAPNEFCGFPSAPWVQTGPSVSWKHGTAPADGGCAHEGIDHNVITSLFVKSTATGKITRCTIDGTETQIITNPVCVEVEELPEEGGEGQVYFPGDGAVFVPPVLPAASSASGGTEGAHHPH